MSGMAEVYPLAPEDRAILALESPTVAGHTCKVVRFARACPDLDALRARIAERMHLAPMLTRRLEGTAERPRWVADERFDLSRHVIGVPVDEPPEEHALPSVLARLFEERLERDRPLWRIDVLPLADGGGALVWRIHHALADGTACVRYARTLLWDQDAAAGAPAAGHAAVHAADDARRRAHLAAFLRREYAPGERRSPFDGTIGGRREIALAAVSLPELHRAARVLAGATVNDAVISVVAGAVGRLVRDHHGPLGTIRVRVPVSLHDEGAFEANRDSYFSVGVPLAEEDPLLRLSAVRAATFARKVADDARERDELLRELSEVPALRRHPRRPPSRTGLLEAHA
jgi:diacylglycerol O-acyltransferase